MPFSHRVGPGSQPRPERGPRDRIGAAASPGRAVEPAEKAAGFPLPRHRPPTGREL